MLDPNQSHNFVQASPTLSYCSPMACRLRFTSPLHKVYFLRQHYRGQQQHVRQDLGVAELLEKILERMDPLVLQTSCGRGVQHQLLERAWQMEIYRAAACSLPPEHWLSPDVGKVWHPGCQCDNASRPMSKDIGFLNCMSGA